MNTFGETITPTYDKILRHGDLETEQRVLKLASFVSYFIFCFHCSHKRFHHEKEEAQTEVNYKLHFQQRTVAGA
jgi:hypothetical protein